jgi:hypothetical protein
MLFNAIAVVSLLVGSGLGVSAHVMKLVNNCSVAVSPKIESTSFIVESPKPLPSGTVTVVELPQGFFGRVCTDAHCNGSMAEFSFARKKIYYDISNILGFTVAQTITTSCDTVSCNSEDCPCSQAYPVGDVSHSGGECRTDAGSGGPLRVCEDMAVTVTYC